MKPTLKKKEEAEKLLKTLTKPKDVIHLLPISKGIYMAGKSGSKKRYFCRDKLKLRGLLKCLERTVFRGSAKRLRNTGGTQYGKIYGSQLHSSLNRFYLNKLYNVKIKSTSVTDGVVGKRVFQKFESDLDNLGLTVIGTEVISTPLNTEDHGYGICTAIDLIAMKEDGSLVGIELKTGYKKNVDVPSRKKYYIEMPLKIDKKITNTILNRHKMQSFVGSLLFNQMYKEKGYKIKQTYVVYLDDTHRFGQYLMAGLNFSWHPNRVLDSFNKKERNQLLQFIAS